MNIQTVNTLKNITFAVKNIRIQGSMIVKDIHHNSKAKFCDGKVMTDKMIQFD